jgi:hypothetical protein
MRSGELRGRTGIWALTADVLGQSTLRQSARASFLRPSRLESHVVIPPEAAHHFRRPLPIGPVSAYQYSTRTYIARPGTINLRTGDFTPARRPRSLEGLLGIVYFVDAAAYGTVGLGYLGYELVDD